MAHPHTGGETPKKTVTCRGRVSRPMLMRAGRPRPYEWMRPHYSMGTWGVGKSLPPKTLVFPRFSRSAGGVELALSKRYDAVDG